MVNLVSWKHKNKDNAKKQQTVKNLEQLFA